jgi:hypothetical protein
MLEAWGAIYYELASEIARLRSALAVAARSDGIDAPIATDLRQDVFKTLDRFNNWVWDASKSDGHFLVSSILMACQGQGDPRLTANTLHGRLSSFAEMLRTSLNNEVAFLHVASDKTHVYMRPLDGWGDTEKAFPSAVREVEAASRCFALNQWTASVFHLMRTLEIGLRTLAVEVKSSIANPSDQNWHRVIETINSAIGKMQPGTATSPVPPVPADLRMFYSDAAMQFMHFKEAFRNHVMHVRIFYDNEDSARVIYSHVRDFMALLATRLSE